MADDARFAVFPPLRCGFATNDPSSPFCGELAYWQRPGGEFDKVRFFCGRHRHELDVAIAGEVLFRRVHISLDVYFASVTLDPRPGQAEALARLDALIQARGGVLNLHELTSGVGRYKLPASPGLEPGRQGSRG